MEFAVFMTLPGPVILLTGPAFLDQLLLRAGRQGQVSTTGFEMLPGGPGRPN
ncbi:hypothetical protein [Streptomyces sp. NPDC058595]|uniref:hypothetical protein n=1 Tax=Streptomyces sp. NPDC058595 TaxID=3346550 RepID=UPI00365411B5